MFYFFFKLTSNRIQIPLHSKLVTFLGKLIIMETKANDLRVTVRKLFIVDWKKGTLQNFQSLRLNQLSPSCTVSAHFQPFSLCFISRTLTVQLRCGLEPWQLCPAGHRALLSEPLLAAFGKWGSALCSASQSAAEYLPALCLHFSMVCNANSTETLAPTWPEPGL